MREGNVHAKSFTIMVTVHQPGTPEVVKNNAEKGGGMYLELNPKLYLQKTSGTDQRLLIFISNEGSYGGAVYVADFLSTC